MDMSIHIYGICYNAQKKVVEYMTISQRIFLLLKEKKRTQKQLSDFTGISTSAISAWNKRGTNPASECLVSIAEFLNVSLEYLLTGQEKSPSSELTENEQKLIDAFKSLTQTQQGEIIGRAQLMAEYNESLYRKEDVI